MRHYAHIVREWSKKKSLIQTLLNNHWFFGRWTERDIKAFSAVSRHQGKDVNYWKLLESGPEWSIRGHLFHDHLFPPVEELGCLCWGRTVTWDQVLWIDLWATVWLGTCLLRGMFTLRCEVVGVPVLWPSVKTKWSESPVYCHLVTWLDHTPVTTDFSGSEWFLANLGCHCQTCFALFARVLWGSCSHWSCYLPSHPTGHSLCLFGVLWLAHLLQATSWPAEKGTVFPVRRWLAGATNRGISHLASLENFKEFW